MNNCIFCKIVKGEIPSVKIWEDEKHLAILDKFPNIKGQTVVIPKEHFGSDVFELPDEVIKDLMIATKKVVKLLEKKLDVKRVAMVCEGMGINHMHVKLYPMHGLKNKFDEIFGGKQQYFEKYPGYVTSEMGPEKSIEELNKIAERIIQKT